MTVAVERGPIDLNFHELAHATLPGFMPSSMVTLDEEFTNSTLTRFTTYSEGSNPNTPSISSNQITFVNNTGQNTLMAENSGLSGNGLVVPQFAVKWRIVSASSTAGNTYENPGVGIIKDANNFMAAVWQRVNGNVLIQVKIGGSNNFRGSVSLALTPPFDIGLSLVSNTLVLWTSADSGVTWTSRTSWALTEIDMRSELLSNGASWHPCFSLATDTAHTFTLVAASFKFGSFGTVGIRDICPVTNTDGTVAMTNNAFNFTATFMDSQGAAYGAVCTYDLIARTLTQNSVYFVNRSSKLYNDGASHFIKDGSGGFYTFVTSWGNAGGPASGINIQYKHETVLNLLSGVNVIASMATPTLPNIPSSGGTGGSYDPFAILNGSTWYLAYTLGPVASLAYYPGLATSTDLSTWSAVGVDTTAVPYEGTRIANLGGSYWLLTSSLNDTNVYDLTMTLQGKMKNPLQVETGTTYPPHPTLVPLGQYTYHTTFDNTEVNSVNGTQGQLHVYRSDRYGLVNPTIYKMRGYYVSGATWEEWTSYGSPNTSPPSGHSLTNITYTALHE